MRIAIVNHLDADAPAVTSEADGFPASNTKGLSRADVWRSKDVGGGATADNSFTYAYTDARAASVLAVMRHNLAGGTVRLQLYSDTIASTQIYDSTVQTIPVADDSMAGSNYGLSGTTVGNADDIFGDDDPFFFYFTPTAFKAAKITFGTGAISTAQGYLSVGRLWLALYTESNNPDYKMGLSFASNTQNARTWGGSLLGNVGEVWRRLDMNVGSLTDEDDRAFWRDVLRYSSNARDLLVDVFDGEASRLGRDYRLNGKIVTLDPLIYDVAFRSQHLVVEEL